MSASSSGFLGIAPCMEGGVYVDDFSNAISWKVLQKTNIKRTGFVEAEQAAFLRDLIDEAPKPVDPRFIAELMVYIGITLQSLDQINIARMLFIEAVDTKVTWQHVFLSLPQIDKSLKIRSLICFAFIIKVYRQVYLMHRFPVEILTNCRWTNTYNQVLLLQLCIWGVSPHDHSIAPYGSVNTEALQSYFQDVRIAPDETLSAHLPYFEHFGPVSNYVWTNSHLVTILLDIALERYQADATKKDAEDMEASRLAYEILRRPMTQCPGLLLATLINSPSIPPVPGRLFAMEVLEYFWKTNQTYNETLRIFRFFATLSPSRFLSMILGAIHLRFPNRLADALAAVKSDSQLLLSVLDGPPAPFRFHLLHVAWSPDFNSAQWLRERLRNDASCEIAREFLLFLALTLCSSDVLHRRLPPQTRYTVGVLSISLRELVYYLTMIVAEYKDTYNIDIVINENWESLADKSKEFLEAELYRLKQAICKIEPLSKLRSLVMILTPNSGGQQTQDFGHTEQPLNPSTNRSEAALESIPPSRSTQPYGLAGATSAKVQPRSTTGQSGSSDQPLFSIDEFSSVTGSGAPPDNALLQEVHGYFQVIYTDEASCDAFIDLMKKLSTYPRNSHEYLVFNHMIKLFFYECRNCLKYPSAELAITSRLIGKLIQEEVLVGHGTYGGAHFLALRCVLEGLRRDPSSDMFAFAVTALEEFVGPRMVSSPDFLSAFICIPEMHKHFPTYVAYAEHCLALLPPEVDNLRYIDAETLASLRLPPPPAIVPNPFTLKHPRQTSNVSSLPNSNVAYNEQAGSSIQGTSKRVGGPKQKPFTDGLWYQRRTVVNGQPVTLGEFGLGAVEELLTAEFASILSEPPTWFKDLVSQVCNSLVMTNLHQRAEEFAAKLQHEWLNYLAVYIVKSRASKEVNLHQLYTAFIERIEHLGFAKLYDLVVTTTYDCINILLTYCDDAMESHAYRTFLNNLGIWLGSLTLARNCPLRSKSIDLKNMLLNGYEHGRLKVLLPLCCAVLDSVEKSRNFRPPNPWSVGIFNLLAEIHSLPTLTTQLSLRIELLFKKLNLDLKDYKGRSNNLAKWNQAQPAADGTGSKEPASNLAESCEDTAAAGEKRPLDSTQQGKEAGPFVPNAFDENAVSYKTVGTAPSTNDMPVYLDNGTLPESHQRHSVNNLGLREVPSGEVASMTTGFQDESGFMEAGSYQAPASTALTNDSLLVRAFGPANAHLGQGNAKFAASSEVDQSTNFSSFTNGIGFNDSMNLSDGKPSALFNGLLKSVVISPSLALFQVKPALKRVVSQAMERAIKEIVNVVSERSVSISCIITLDIVLKDFAAEINSSLVRRAAHLMAASLAGSLALVTCREPLRAALCQHLRTLLIAANEKLGDDRRLVDQVVVVATADNIELGCTFVEEAVIHKALHDIEKSIAPALAVRRQARAMGHTTYQDPLYFRAGSQWPANLPPPLRLPPVLTSAHLQIYRDFLSFGVIKRMQSNTAIQSTTRTAEKVPTAGKAIPTTMPLGDIFTHPNPPASGQIHDVREPNGMSRKEPLPHWRFADMQAATTKIEENLSRLRNIVEEIAICSPIYSFKLSPSTEYATPAGAIAYFMPNRPMFNNSLRVLSYLHSNHEVFSLLNALPTLCSVFCGHRNAYCTIAQKILNMMTKSSTLYQESIDEMRTSNLSGLFVEICVGAVSLLCRSPDFPANALYPDIAAWITNSLTSGSFSIHVTLTFLRYKLLTLPQLDQILTNSLVSSTEKNKLKQFETIAKIVYKITADLPVYVGENGSLIMDLKTTIEHFSRILLKSGYGLLAERELGLGASVSGQPTPYIVFDAGVQLTYPEAQDFIFSRLAEAAERSETSKKTDEPKGNEMIVTVNQLLEAYATSNNLELRVHRYPLPPKFSDNMKELTIALFHQWILCSLVVSTEKRSKIWATYLQSLSKERLLQMDEVTDAFFCGCMTYAIEMHQAALEKINQINRKDENATVDLFDMPTVDPDIAVLKPLDAFAKMIVTMMRLIDSTQISPVLVLQRALSVIVRCIHRDSQDPKTFKPQAYYRILLSLNYEVIQPNRGLDQQMMSSIISFCNALQAVNPCVCPAFAYCWLDFLSSRYFLPKLLKNHGEWHQFQQLLSSLFIMLNPFLSNLRISPSVHLLYTGLLRLLLVLLHDSPEFLCNYHIVFNNLIPINAIQLRNLILSPFPRNIKLPEPFALNVKADAIPEMNQLPRCADNSAVVLQQFNVLEPLQKFWMTQDDALVEKICQLIWTTDDVKDSLNTQHVLISSLLSQIAAHLQAERADLSITKLDFFEEMYSSFKIIKYIVSSVSSESRYVFLNIMTNQLRYPNLYTQYFSSIFLWIFFTFADNEQVQEQITRILMQRLGAHRPHSWGLLVTFMELIENPKFDFWNRSFVHSVPVVQRLFQSVTKICFGQKNPSGQAQY